MIPDAVSLLVLLGLCAVAAWTDLRGMRIPNRLCLAGLAVFVLLTPFLGWAEVADRLWLAVPTFGICFAMFALGLIGGGDAKFFPVMMLFVPPGLLQGFLMSLSAGIALALAGLWLARRHPRAATSSWQGLRERRRFPMGVACLLSVLGFVCVVWSGAVSGAASGLV